ncbi:MAG TPA: hypothetical protein VIC27_12385, partial [Ktedonobacterales bacterium]
TGLLLTTTRSTRRSSLPRAPNLTGKLTAPAFPMWNAGASSWRRAVGDSMLIPQAKGVAALGQAP